MANQIALKLLARPGDVLIAERVLARRDLRVRGRCGARRADDARAARATAAAVTRSRCGRAAEPSSKVADQRAAVLSLEDTHNSSGGRVWPLDELDEVVARRASSGSRCTWTARGSSTPRLRSAVAPAEIAARFDTVTLCLSKGLGCPLGALLAGSRELMERAWREKHLFGGAMRQAGIVAAAGVYALDHHVDRLADDHARARRLAEALDAAGCSRSTSSRSRRTSSRSTRRRSASHASEALARLAAGGVGLSATIHPTVMRAVTHLDVTDDGHRAGVADRARGAARAGVAA